MKRRAFLQGVLVSPAVAAQLPPGDKTTQEAPLLLGGDYRPLDLADVCNTGTEFLGGAASPPLGNQLFHGLPFRVGRVPPDSKHCLIGFSGTQPRVEIRVNSAAENLLFAHLLLESGVREGGPIGQIVADYVFRYATGEEQRVAIRERFEIGIMRPGGGELPCCRPFLALPNCKPGLMPRYQGAWDDIGKRQIEVFPDSPSHYYLWNWRNPKPSQVIDRIVVEPKGGKFVIAGITLGDAKENPFCREAKREVRIELRPDRQNIPFRELEVDVDRGVVTYPFALPKTSAEEFLGDAFHGWGEAQNPGSSPIYVEVAAIPSATLRVRQGNRELGSGRWGELNRQGRISTPLVDFEIVDRGRNWVHVTVVDEETGKPIPCRVHFRSPEGVPYQPHGHHNHVNSNLDSMHADVGGDLRLGQVTYAYIDGTCQGWLPRGDVIVDVARGFEYEPLRARVSLVPGQRELKLRLRRWIDMNSRRWFSGDSHVHFLSTAGAHREAQGEDLNVVNLLQSQWGHLFTNTEEFTGEPSVSRQEGTIVYCSQENRQHMLGHLILWGLKHPVMPWCTDGPGSTAFEAELGGTLEETMSGWADACRSQGGVVILPHFPYPNGEPAALVATGRVDAIELPHDPYSQLEYYRYLNCGYRLPLVGGTDKMSSDVPVGVYRTYAHIPEGEEFSYTSWCKAVCEGRTFLSGGPILHFSVEGQPIGDMVRMKAPGTLEVEAWAESTLPIYALEVVQEGRVVASVEEAKGARRLQLREKVKVKGHTWLAARCGGKNFGAARHHDLYRCAVFAHTSPVYIAVGGEWWLMDAATARYMLTLVEGGLAYIRHTAPLHPDDTTTHHHGASDHLAHLTRPFLEAQLALQRRLQGHGR